MRSCLSLQQEVRVYALHTHQLTTCSPCVKIIKGGGWGLIPVHCVQQIEILCQDYRG